MSDIVYLDSCTFLAWLKEEEGRVDIIASLFAEADAENLLILTSTLTIAEVLNLQGKSPIPVEQRQAVNMLFKNEWIVPKSVTRRIAEISQELVWEYGIKPKDGIHVATAITYRVKELYTYDNGLSSKGLLSTSWGEVNISEPLPPAQGKLKF